MRYIAILYLFLFDISVHGQNTKPCPCNDELNESFETQLKGQVYHRLAGMVGREFYTPTFVNGDVFLENGEVAVDQQVRYNGRIDGLLLLPSNNREILLDNYFIKGFCIKNMDGSSNIYFSKIKVVKDFSSDSVEIFGQVLYQNKLSLYAYRRYVYQGDVLEYISKTRIARKSFGPSFVYYFHLPNNKTIGFKKFKRKDLYAIFPGHKDAMKKLFKENHQRKFKKETDLIRITEILNGVITDFQSF